MIDHYHFRQDGLLCKLKIPVECPGYRNRIASKWKVFSACVWELLNFGRGKMVANVL